MALSLIEKVHLGIACQARTSERGFPAREGISPDCRREARKAGFTPRSVSRTNGEIGDGALRSPISSGDRSHRACGSPDRRRPLHGSLGPHEEGDSGIGQDPPRAPHGKPGTTRKSRQGTTVPRSGPPRTSPPLSLRDVALPSPRRPRIAGYTRGTAPARTGPSSMRRGGGGEATFLECPSSGGPPNSPRTMRMPLGREAKR